MRSSESLGRETLKMVWMVLLVTVISVCSGSAELNSHSSSRAAGVVAAAVAAVVVEGRAELEELPLLVLPMPRRSRFGDEALECVACWKGDACRGGVARAANGSDFFA